MSGKTFVFGVGAQKAGTTWLHDYLAGRADSYFGFTKEYHIFDALKFPGKIRKNFEKRMASALEKPWPSWRKMGLPCLLAMMARPEVYFNYFSGILCQEGITLTGDITPEYACLDREVMEAVRDGFEERGVRVAPVFIMRDPVERLHSMLKDQRRRDGGSSPTAKEELDELYRNQNSYVDNVRSDYRQTVRTLNEVFGNDVFYGLYEELFTEACIGRLCEFLNVAYVVPRFEEQINSTPRNHPIPDEDKEKLVQGYIDRYEFALEFFGKRRVEAAWPNVRYLREERELS